MTGEPLGNKTNYVSPPAKQRQARALRFELRDQARRILPEARVSWCGHKLKPGAGGVSVWTPAERPKAHIRGARSCGSVWACPVCASRITEVRRAELAQATEKVGFSRLLVTLTLQHGREDSLAQLLEALNDSFRRMKMGKGWQNFKAKWGIVAYVTALEVTYSLEAGFHPHKHMLIFSNLPAEEIDEDEFKIAITRRYKAQLAKHSVYASDLYGVDVKKSNDAVAGYVAKWGVVEEITKAPTKAGRDGHYSPFQLLDLARQGVAWAGPVFREYAQTLEGKRQLTWSRGARDVLGLNEEKPDEEIANEDETEGAPELLFVISAPAWYRLCERRAVVHLLEAVEDWREDEFLSLYGIQIGRDQVARLEEG